MSVIGAGPNTDRHIPQPNLCDTLEQNGVQGPPSSVGSSILIPNSTQLELRLLITRGKVAIFSRTPFSSQRRPHYSSRLRYAIPTSPPKCAPNRFERLRLHHHRRWTPIFISNYRLDFERPEG